MAVPGGLSLNCLELGFPFRVESVLKEMKTHSGKLWAVGCLTSVHPEARSRAAVVGRGPVRV